MKDIKPMDAFGKPKKADTERKLTTSNLFNNDSVDLIAMDKLYSNPGNPYRSIFAEEEIDGIIYDFIDIIEVMFEHPEAADSSSETFRHADGKRQDPNIALSELEIKYIKSEIAEIHADTVNIFGEELFVFNAKSAIMTYYDDETDTIYIKRDIFPDYQSYNHYDLVSVRAVLAHEYWGHRWIAQLFPEHLGLKGSNSDEALASATAAKECIYLRSLDKEQLLRDVGFRTKSYRNAKVNFITKWHFYDKIDEIELNKIKGEKRDE